MAKDRIDRDEEDLVRLYLTDIGQYALLTKDDEVRLAKAIETGKQATAELETNDKSVTPNRRRELRKDQRDGTKAERQFVQSNLRLVVSIAKKYQAQGVPAELAIRTGSFLDEFSLLDVIEIANRQNSSPEVVAELYFALSERYDIDRMLFHISALARDDRWTAYARSALRSDLYVALAALTSRVVQATKDSDSIDVRISQWEAKFAEGVARTRATLNEIAHSEQNDLATLSVALRAIRTLAGQGAS